MGAGSRRFKSCHPDLMRIISPFKDCYDKLLAHDQDYSTLFIREQKTLEITNNLNISSNVSYKNKVYPLQYLGFCGQYFVVMKYQNEYAYYGKNKASNNWPLGTKFDPRYLFYNREPLDLNEHFSKLNYLFDDYHYFLIGTNDILHYRQAKLPVLTYPVLKDIQFPKIMDIYQIYQTLQTLIYNKATPFKPIPKVTDKDLITAKGFNKHSFRKEKLKP